MDDTSMPTAENTTPPTVAECEARLNQCRDDVIFATEALEKAQAALKKAIANEREAVKAFRAAYEAAMPKRPRAAKIAAE
jgi:hypothetical protein